MPYVIPEDPFTRDLGQSLQVTSQNLSAGYLKGAERKKEYQSNYNLATALGVPDTEAKQFASMNPAQASAIAQSYVQNQQIPNVSEFFINALGIDSTSPQAEAFRNAKSLDTLMAMGKFVQTQKNENTPMKINKELRLENEAVDKKYNRAIKDIQEGVKGGLIRDEKSARQSIQNLRTEQGKNNDNIINNRPLINDAFKEYIDVFSEKPNIKKNNIAPKEQTLPKQEKQKKIKFDPKNEEHNLIKNNALKQAQGDKNLANQLLNEMFS